MPEYTILGENESLDEGVAIVYHHIYDEISRNQVENNEKSILILDCGGGTTDLASCAYRMKQTAVTKKLYITTDFENGDSNFGGNNITYRILQILKIKIAAQQWNGKDVSMTTLIPKKESEILTKIDEVADLTEAKQDIYDKFEEAYAAAEGLIPTKFADCQFEDEQRDIKRNYYYLWQMAEDLKIAFYQSDLATVDFDKEGSEKLCFPDEKQYYIYIRKDGKLQKLEAPLKELEITNIEIQRVICGDLYGLLDSLLNPIFGEEKADYTYYKLSGQSCIINLFHELLKEFIPGKKIRRNRRDDSKNEELKLECIRGSIEYVKTKDEGRIKPTITMNPPQLVYAVTYDDKVLLDKDQVVIHYAPDSASNLPLTITDQTGITKRQISYDIRQEGKTIDLAELSKRIGNQTYWDAQQIKTQIIDPLADFDLKEESDNDPVYAIFVVPATSGYGINIYQVLMEAGEEEGSHRYTLQNDGQFECFADETLESFFNGKR